MRLDVDVKSIRVIPKSVLKIGVKLPEVGGGSKSTPDLSRKGDGHRDEKNLLDGFDLSENPFIKNDQQRLLGKSLFRPSFSRIGINKSQWKEPPAPHPLHAEFKTTSGSQLVRSGQQKVQKELTAVLRRQPAPPALSQQQQDVHVDIMATVKKRDDVDSKAKKGLLHLKGWVSTNLSSCSLSGVTSCVRCRQPVYPLEKVEPVTGQPLHPQCFRCAECQTKLSLATFCTGQQPQKQPQTLVSLYCRAHQPKQDKVMLCHFSTRKSSFPAFKLGWAAGDCNGNSHNRTSPTSKHA